MISMRPLFGILAYREISLKKFSKMTGISYVTLEMMKKKRASFTVEKLNTICSVLDVGISDIIRYEPDA